jgi:MoaA/NifB/PqqE/SkfB family radical SAM enzyme
MKKIIEKISRNTKNLILAPRNLIFRALNIPLKPKWVVLMTTDRCNSRCSHCNIWREKKVDKILTPDEIEKIFSDKLFKNVKYVLCTGGESTTRDDLEEVFLRLHKALPEATLQLSTNAILPERAINVVETAMKNGITLDVGVSLDGIGEDHDKIRGVPGNFQKADWLLHKLVELRDNKYPGKLGIAAGIVVSDLTVDSFDKVREYAEKLDIILVEAWYNQSSFYSNCNDGDKLKVKEKIAGIVKSQPPSLLQEKWLEYLKGKPLKFPCFAMSTFCVIKCNGDVAPCLSLWDLKAGNMRDSSPTEVWQSLQAKQVRKNIKKCEGCLNTWGAGWSFEGSYYQTILYYLKHPKILIKKLTSK